MSELSESPRGAVLSLREAAAATGVSYSTIKRRQADFTHAYRDHGGVWRVPVSDLLGAGLHLRPRSETQVDQAVTQGHDPGQNGAELAQALARIETLTADLAGERMARQVAEARVAAYAANLDDLRFSLRAISGPPQAPEPVQASGTAPTTPEPVQAAPPPAEPPRRGLWARLRGG